MKKFQKTVSIITPLERSNVDTDQIVPKQFLKLIQKTGFGKFLFYNWRYDKGEENPDFVLNDPKYGESRILLAGKNFGCGSSREHAVWALQDYGFSVVIAPSFADIFYSNCFKNGVLAVVLGREKTDVLRDSGLPASVDLEGQIITSGPHCIPFKIDPHKKRILLEGIDEISITLQYEEKISEFERDTSVPSVL